MCKSQNAGRKLTRNLINLQPKEILDLSTGNNDGNAVREAYDYRTRNELNRRTQTCCAQDQQDDSSQQGAHEQAVGSVFRDNSKYHHHECTSWPAYLC